MTTKFYLRNSPPIWRTAADYGVPTAGEKSTTQPTQANVYEDSSRDSYYLDPAKNVFSTSGSTWTITPAAFQYSIRMGRFASLPLIGGTYGSGTWTVGLFMGETAIAQNLFMVNGSVYFWRPSTQQVVGFVADGDTASGLEVDQAATGRTRTFTGSNVTIQTGDCLVYEAWFKTVAATSATLVSFTCNGPSDVVSGDSTSTNTAAYIQAPADIPILMNARWG